MLKADLSKHRYASKYFLFDCKYYAILLIIHYEIIRFFNLAIFFSNKNNVFFIIGGCVKLAFQPIEQYVIVFRRKYAKLWPP